MGIRTLLEHHRRQFLEIEFHRLGGPAGERSMLVAGNYIRGWCEFIN